MDKTEIDVLLEFILESINLIKKRFNKINCVDDFLEEDGLMVLDSISMRLQAIGEALKNIDKKDREFLIQVAPKSYWSKIIKTREIISHHYVNLDAEIVFEICATKLDELEEKILKLKEFL
ncbi:MAG: DUF86 domain-containing protein [Epsilonproteobacteria bacterium]|nr:DUF86 domain-containing protein [Campylobacterota bacterium]